MSNDPGFDQESSSELYLITQVELHDLVRDFELPKNKAALLGSQLQQYNLLAADVRVSKLCDGQQQFNTLFFMEGDQVACNNINGLMAALNNAHDPCDWRYFIHLSKMSFKVALLHNGNIKPSIPLGYAVHMKETYDNIKQLLR